MTTGLAQITVDQTQDPVHIVIVSFDLTCVEDVMAYLQGMKTVSEEAAMPESPSVLLCVRWGREKNTTENPNQPATF